MRRRSLAATVLTAVTALSVTLTGCTGGDGGEDTVRDAKPGQGTRVAAQPGKYRTLPEPCGALGHSTLKNLLPGLGELVDEQRKKALRGTAASTYDTDRRVGCGWSATSPDASHTLSVDFERVVSYEGSVSDDDRAQEVFVRRQSTALPALAADQGRTSSAPASAPPDAAASAASGAVTAGGAVDGGEEDDGNLAPRALDSLGDAAFLNDVLNAAGTGSTAQRRTVSVVFRTSNVIVTIVYAEQSGRTAEQPDSKELQEKARSVARSLAHRFAS
ncbi:DUF3558 domain-containing protein [Streptomyces sp. NPDC057638]|uniref:DUF3558 domain-containing protein n=1 Tax=Streptomyces sp. NPDC057638 TaxID=3346190 RepID=UPI00368A76BE